MNRVKRFCLLFALSLFLFSAIRAQQTNPSGYYVSLTKDTVAGSFPNYRETAHNPSAITFLPRGSTREIRLVPDSCLAVSIDQSDKFLVYHGKLLTNPTSALDADATPNDQYAQVSVFLRELYNDGNYSLYELAGKQRQNFFVSGDTLRLQELIYKTFIEGGHIIESDEFRQQLSHLFSDRLSGNASLYRSLQRLRYDETQLLKFFRRGTGNQNVAARQKYPARFFVGLGLSANFLTVKPIDPTLYYIKTPYKTTFSPMFQAGVDVPLGRGREKLFLSFMLQGYTFKNTTTQSGVGTDTYKATAINLPVSLGYWIVKGPTASLAVSAGMLAVYVTSFSQKISYEGSAITAQDTYPGRLDFTEFGGLELFLGKQISIAATYSLPYTVEPYVYYSPRHNAAQLSVRLGW